MSSRLEKLLMRVELIDQVTAPAKKVMASIDKLTARAESGFKNMAGGAVALLGVALTFTTITAEARDMQRALGEVRSLSVNEAALQKLERTAKEFSIAYGESATDFVRSAYDIQSAIGGLTGDELSRFTEASNVLAKGTKADAATITNYMGTMYGIFKQNADAMGKSKWVEQLAGQTAQAVEMFKTTGVQMSGAFTALGADAKSHGIAINEQMAVLGKLQATMSGSEAGTKYKAFLRGVGAAQEKLGLQFTDSAGRMLPVTQILAKLQNKFGAIDTVAKSDALKQAFGSDEAVAMIKLMMQDTQGLGDAIEQLGSIKGMDKAAQMAAAMVDPLDQITQANNALRMSFGKVINQALLPFFSWLTTGLGKLTRWLDMFPNIARWVGYLTIAFIGFSGALALFAVAKGAFLIGAAGMTTALTVLRWALVPLSPLLGALRLGWLVFRLQLIAGTAVIPALRVALMALGKQLLLNLRSLSLVRAATWLYAGTLRFMRAAVLAAAIRFPALIAGLVAMKSGFISAMLGAKAFAIALMTNPITWMVLGVVALVAGLVMLVRHWETVKTAVLGFVAAVGERWQSLRAYIEDNAFLNFIFTPLLATVDLVAWLIGVFAQIPTWFGEFKNWLAAADLFAPFRAGIDWVARQWAQFRALLEDNAFLGFLFTPLTMAVDGVELLLQHLGKIPEFFQQFKTWLSGLGVFDVIGKSVDWLIEKLNMIPGVNIGKGDLVETQAAEPVPGLTAAQLAPFPPVLEQPKPANLVQLPQAANPAPQPPALLAAPAPRVERVLAPPVPSPQVIPMPAAPQPPVVVNAPAQPLERIERVAAPPVPSAQVIPMPAAPQPPVVVNAPAQPLERMERVAAPPVPSAQVIPMPAAPQPPVVVNAPAQPLERIERVAAPPVPSAQVIPMPAAPQPPVVVNAPAQPLERIERVPAPPVPSAKVIPMPAAPQPPVVVNAPAPRAGRMDHVPTVHAEKPLTIPREIAIPLPLNFAKELGALKEAGQKALERIQLPALPSPAPLVVKTPDIKFPPIAEDVQRLAGDLLAERERIEPDRPSIKEHVPSGGLRSQINNSDNSKTVRIDKLEVNTTQKVNAYNLLDELKMVGG